MNTIIKNTIAIITLSITLTSCSKDEANLSGNGNLELEFDNVFGRADLSYRKCYNSYGVFYDGIHFLN